MDDMKKIEEVPVHEIPEVLEFLDANERLEEFKARNPELLSQLAILIEDYNNAMENADKAVRAKGVNCGPWEQLTPSVKYDGEKLYSAVGREDFVRLGGVVRQINDYVIDKGVIEAAISANRLPQQIVELVRTVGRKYKSLPKGQLP
jgi:hypothetical protein